MDMMNFDGKAVPVATSWKILYQPQCHSSIKPEVIDIGDRVILGPSASAPNLYADTVEIGMGANGSVISGDSYVSDETGVTEAVVDEFWSSSEGLPGDSGGAWWDTGSPECESLVDYGSLLGTFFRTGQSDSHYSDNCYRNSSGEAPSAKLNSSPSCVDNLANLDNAAVGQVATDDVVLTRQNSVLDSTVTGGHLNSGLNTLTSECLASMKRLQVQSGSIAIRKGQTSLPVSETASGAQKFLCGDGSVIQTLGAVTAVQNLFQKYLPDDFDLHRCADPLNAQTLNVELEHPDAYTGGPFYRHGRFPTIFTDSAATSADADVIAHEMGHAILDGVCDYDTSESFTASAHEAFADTTALLTACQNSQVRAQMLQAWEKGQMSTVASVIAEGSSQIIRCQPSVGSLIYGGEGLSGVSKLGGWLLAGEQGQMSPVTLSAESWAEQRLVDGESGGAIRGLRDLAQLNLTSPEQSGEEPHEASLRYSHGMYRALHSLYGQMKDKSPEMEPAEVLTKATDRISADFVISLTKLPKSEHLTQSDLARALLQANRELNGGKEVELYRNCFEGLELS